MAGILPPEKVHHGRLRFRLEFRNGSPAAFGNTITLSVTLIFFIVYEVSDIPEGRVETWMISI